MPLLYSAPPENLARELREVGRDASELINALNTGLNYSLPPGFPTQQLISIAETLSKLDAGTAEGCRAALEYARNRVPAIRREFLLSEELDDNTLSTDGLPQASRGTLIDQRLKDVISSTTTALDEYRLLATAELSVSDAEASETEAPSGMAASAIEGSFALEQQFNLAAKIIEEVAQPKSSKASDLRRQISDGAGQNRLVQAELRMTRPVTVWLRATVAALRNYPAVIKQTTEAVRATSDITQKGLKIWSDFKKTNREALFIAITRVCDLAEEFAEQVEERRRKSHDDKVRQQFYKVYHLTLSNAKFSDILKQFEIPSTLVSDLSSNGINFVGDLFLEISPHLNILSEDQQASIMDFKELVEPIIQPTSQTLQDYATGRDKISRYHQPLEIEAWAELRERLLEAPHVKEVLRKKQDRQQRGNVYRRR